jgi:hypothetical protein
MQIERISTVAAALVLMGCGGEKSTTIPTGDGGSVKVTQSADGETAEITTITDDGEATFTSGGAGKWPDDAPAYAPPYPGAKVEGGFSGTADGQAGAMTTFTTADPPEKVVEFYKRRAEAAGLAAKSTATIGNAVMFSAQDKTGDVGLSVQAGSENGVTTAMLSYSRKAG